MIDDGPVQFDGTVHKWAIYVTKLVSMNFYPVLTPIINYTYIA